MKTFEVLRTSPIKRLRNLLTSGNLWLYILSLIRLNKRIYAYRLDEEIEKEYLFRPNKVMIYVVLYKLENEKLIKSEFEGRRKYYTITEKGIEALEFAKDYFRALSAKL
ncbi:PadR family transcriptional regulator [Candidatus Micrarchaeota archaeon]|nr:PadR family transcriptional regulator [Candidatus Micrarchaeota archaeon]